MAASEWVKGYYWFVDISGWYAKNETITIDKKEFTIDDVGYYFNWDGISSPNA